MFISRFISVCQCVRAVTTKKPSLFRNVFRNMSAYQYETLNVKSEDYVVHVEFNRPDQRNAMNKDFWRELLDCFHKIKDDKECRSVIVSGSGKAFCAGIDLADLMELASKVMSNDDVARKAKYLYSVIEQYQQSFTAIDECNKPVIAAIHGACVGAGTSLISSCDMRYCTKDAYFSIKEVDLGLAADVGVLQRLPKAIGNDGLLREYLYTCEKIDPDFAKEIGIVSRIFPTKEEMMANAKRVAAVIASKSPVAVQGTKRCLNYSRDHSVKEGLEYMSLWNMTMLQSEDIFKAAGASISKSEKPVFSKL